MQVKLLPSSFDEQGNASQEQRLTCLLIDDCVAVDAGSIGLALSDAERERIRDVIVTHTHIDHVGSLPIFVDDMFGTLREPICVYSTDQIIGRLESDIFNWRSYPRFTELRNAHTGVMSYLPIEPHVRFRAAHLDVLAVEVSHSVPTLGLFISDGTSTLAITSDTTITHTFWEVAKGLPRIDTLIIECSFPNEMQQLAEVSGHLTPNMLRDELKKFTHPEAQILAVHLKPSYREQLIEEIAQLNLPHLSVMTIGHPYEVGSAVAAQPT